MAINFTKVQGNWNDFVIVDEYDQELLSEASKPEFAALVCSRRNGVGADGVLFISKPKKAADLRMRIFQVDRSEPEMSGNGASCVAKYAKDMGYVGDSCRIETASGIISVSCQYQRLPTGNQLFVAHVTMPTPLFLRKDIPATGDDGNTKCRERIGEYDVIALRVGVPHAIVFMEDVVNMEVSEVLRLGQSIRSHALFPEGTNVDFVQYMAKNRLKIRTYARGLEQETVSCGTGACAAAVVLHDMNACDADVSVETNGGLLNVHIDHDTVTVDTTATTVFKGVIPFSQAKNKVNVLSSS